MDVPSFEITSFITAPLLPYRSLPNNALCQELLNQVAYSRMTHNLLETRRQLGAPRGLVILMFKKNESLLPFLSKHFLGPLRELGLGVIRPAQTQITPRNGVDNFLYRVLVCIFQAKAEFLSAKQGIRPLTEPRLVPE